MPRSPAPIRHEPQNFFRKIAERPRKAQKGHRKPIRAAKMYKKIIMQKNMQKINLCRHGMQLPVDMPYKALKRPTMAFCIAPISEYPQRLKWP